MNDQSHWYIYSTEKIGEQCWSGRYVAIEGPCSGLSPLYSTLLRRTLWMFCLGLALNPDLSALYSSLNHDCSNLTQSFSHGARMTGLVSMTRGVRLYATSASVWAIKCVDALLFRRTTAWNTYVRWRPHAFLCVASKGVPQSQAIPGNGSVSSDRIRAASWPSTLSSTDCTCCTLLLRRMSSDHEIFPSS